MERDRQTESKSQKKGRRKPGREEGRWDLGGANRAGPKEAVGSPRSRGGGTRGRDTDTTMHKVGTRRREQLITLPDMLRRAGDCLHGCLARPLGPTSGRRALRKYTKIPQGTSGTAAGGGDRTWGTCTGGPTGHCERRGHWEGARQGPRRRPWAMAAVGVWQERPTWRPPGGTWGGQSWVLEGRAGRTPGADPGLEPGPQ